MYTVLCGEQLSVWNLQIYTFIQIHTQIYTDVILTTWMKQVRTLRGSRCIYELFIRAVVGADLRSVSGREDAVKESFHGEKSLCLWFKVNFSFLVKW